MENSLRDLNVVCQQTVVCYSAGLYSLQYFQDGKFSPKASTVH